VVFSAFLDACTLVPINLTDLLLRLAEADAYRPLWSADVLAEVEHTLPQVSDAMTETTAHHRVAVMQAAFPDAEVRGYQSLIPTMTNAPKDRHVLAATVSAGAALIVTANLADFPTTACRPYGIEAVHPDDFLLDQLELYPDQTLQCLQELVTARQRPTETLQEFLAQLTKTVPRFSNQVHPRA
jgi:predicted nucleic acid-binding protein